MEAAFAFIGFGEAGAAFAGGAPARGYDRKTDAATSPAKHADFARARVAACTCTAEALADIPAALSLVTADRALAAAETAAPLLARGALWVAPSSLRSALPMSPRSRGPSARLRRSR